jgi:hypothetical protein
MEGATVPDDRRQPGAAAVSLAVLLPRRRRPRERDSDQELPGLQPWLSVAVSRGLIASSRLHHPRFS